MSNDNKINTWHVTGPVYHLMVFGQRKHNLMVKLNMGKQVVVSANADLQCASANFVIQPQYLPYGDHLIHP